MRKLFAGLAVAGAAMAGTVTIGIQPAHADADSTCRWMYPEDGQYRDYTPGAVKVEDWGISRTPDGRWVRTLRYFACRPGNGGGWWDLVRVEEIQVEGPGGEERRRGDKEPILT